MEEWRFDEEWLTNRLELFRRYTYPSVVAQADQKFEWTGLVHKDSPDWFLNSFKEFPRITIVQVEVDTEVGNPNTVTINLDSDDAIARDFIKHARKQIHPEKVTYFETGYRMRVSTGVCVRTKSKANPFTIVPPGHMTVLERSHGQWGESKLISGYPAMWMQIIHEQNVDNRLKKARRSRPIPLSQIRKEFSIDPIEPWL
jgi:hypothetical protein